MTLKERTVREQLLSAIRAWLRDCPRGDWNIEGYGTPSAEYVRWLRQLAKEETT